MNKKRLQMLRDALIEHAKDAGNLKFCLYGWLESSEKYDGEDAVKVARLARAGKNYCGTTACALGLAASLPQFNRVGLRLDRINCGAAEVRYRRAGVELEGFEAGAEFFDISLDDACELFSPSGYITRDVEDPLAVADKITALLETA